MTDLETAALFKCLADTSRLRILRSLASGDMYVEQLSERLDLAPSTVSFHLRKLADAGLVESARSQYYVMYSLRRELLGRTMLELVQEESDEAALQEERERLWRQKVLDSFIGPDGRLKIIPAQRKKRNVILERIVEAFESGREYPEREVNRIIAEFHDDFATLRRELIDERLMTREGGVYRRA